MAEFNYSANVRKLADLAFDAIMRQGMSGIYTPIVICGVSVTCADDNQSIRNRFCDKMKSVDFDDIKNAISYFESSK